MDRQLAMEDTAVKIAFDYYYKLSGRMTLAQFSDALSDISGGIVLAEGLEKGLNMMIRSMDAAGEGHGTTNITPFHKSIYAAIRRAVPDIGPYHALIETFYVAKTLDEKLF